MGMLNIDGIKRDCQVFGMKNDEWEKFEKDIEYEGIFSSKKIIVNQRYQEVNSKKTLMVIIYKVFREI